MNLKNLLKKILYKLNNSNFKNYSKITKLVLYLWFLLQFTFAILNILIFLNPYWFGNVNLNTIPIELSNLDSVHSIEVEPVASALESSNHMAYFGLYRYCVKLSVGSDTRNNKNHYKNQTNTTIETSSSNYSLFKCSGHWTRPSSFLDIYLKTSTYLIGTACILSVMCVLLSFLIVFVLPQVILLFTSFIQIIIGNLNIVFFYYS
jgi:hypothetical protein